MMKKIQIPLLFLTLCCFGFTAMAQNVVIDYTETEQLTINGLLLNGDTKVTIQELIDEIGNPKRMGNQDRPKNRYSFVDQGITVGTKDDFITSITIYYQQNNREEVRQSDFSGELTISGRVIRREDIYTDFENLPIYQIDCPYPNLCNFQGQSGKVRGSVNLGPTVQDLQFYIF